MLPPRCRLLHAICYGAADRGGPELSSLSDLRLTRIAVIGTLAATLGLAGCGRKGGLDPPPEASTAAANGVSQPGPPPELGPDGQPTVPPSGPRRRTPIDFLID
jgi:predicted small lipoprotein YifL